MQKTSNNPRRDFLKRIPIAIISIGAFSFFGQKKHNRFTEKKFNTLSKTETDKIIKAKKFSIPTRIKPAPAPVASKNIKG
ncbi:MAG: hypothetical protein CL661_02415 [Bacteroidetes bacterium]|nr:hypothetical protein [Bacteroidota bacterium]